MHWQRMGSGCNGWGCHLLHPLQTPLPPPPFPLFRLYLLQRETRSPADCVWTLLTFVTSTSSPTWITASPRSLTGCCTLSAVYEDMAKTFAISESMLRELYERQQLSVAEMAAVLSCKPSLLRKTMAECGILPRSRSEAMRIKRAKDPDRLVPIPPAALKRLYEACGWTAAHIAEHYGCSVGTVLNRLRLSGIALSPPGRPVVEIPRSELEALYLEQRLSLRQIARHYGCDHSTIKNKLEEYGLPLRNYAEANRIYPRRDFDGGEADKAYLVGFRLGDLHVTMMGEMGQTVVVECTTTKQEQLDLIADLFAPYGHVYVGKQKRRGDVGITCYLNMSFAFLLPKEDAIPEWAQSGTAALTAFAAGYIDAEAVFISVRISLTFLSVHTTGVFSLGCIGG